jgi:phosphoglycolate phosphatase-like HAD superfamily hydrolase
MIENYRSAVFDFDGVILDSNQGKLDAFRKTLAGDSPEVVERFLAYHIENGGVSRYVKFEHYYRHMLGWKDYAVATAEALQRFGMFARQVLMEAEEIPGAIALLDTLRERSVPCFIVTGGAEDEVRDVVKERGLDRFFSRVLGAPATKKENLQKLADQESLLKPSVFYGDAKADLHAARAFDLAFIFVSGVSEWHDGPSVCREQGLPIIKDFVGLI